MDLFGKGKEPATERASRKRALPDSSKSFAPKLATFALSKQEGARERDWITQRLSETDFKSTWKQFWGKTQLDNGTYADRPKFSLGDHALAKEDLIMGGWDAERGCSNQPDSTIIYPPLSLPYVMAMQTAIAAKSPDTKKRPKPGLPHGFFRPPRGLRLFGVGL